MSYNLLCHGAPKYKLSTGYDKDLVSLAGWNIGPIVARVNTLLLH